MEELRDSPMAKRVQQNVVRISTLVQVILVEEAVTRVRFVLILKKKERTNQQLLKQTEGGAF